VTPEIEDDIIALAKRQAEIGDLPGPGVEISWSQDDDVVTIFANGAPRIQMPGQVFIAIKRDAGEDVSHLVTGAWER
jgi:hypothetical protein